MGLRSLFRRLFKRHISSWEFAHHAAKATVRAATERPTARPVLRLLRQEGLESSEEPIQRELVLLLHFSTYMALTLHHPRASDIYEQCTQWLIVFLTRHGLWDADRTEELTREYVIRQELFLSVWNDASRWPLLATPTDMSTLCFRLARVPLYSLADEPEIASEAGESHMELASYAEAFFEKMQVAVTGIWIDFEHKEIGGPGESGDGVEVPAG